METYGFHFRYRMCGQPPTIREFVFKDSETITAGDLVNIETSEYADLAATADTAIIGAAVETLTGVTTVTKIKVITDDDAVYAVTDANAREMGAILDLTGATGAQQVTTDSNHNFVVVEYSAATEPTLVRISTASHPTHY